METPKAKALWILKYAPRLLSQCAGNDEPRDEMRKWAVAWQAGKREKPLMLAGPTGVGKSAAVRGLAEEMGWQLFESNSSEMRDREYIDKNFAATAGSRGLFGQTRLLLVDEVDAVVDKGGAAAIASFLAGSQQPAIVVANDAWDQKITLLRTSCKMVDFKAVNARSVKKVLESIAEKEGIIDIALIEQAAASCEGDLRAAIGDLQAGFVGERERKDNIFKVIGKIMKTMDYREAMKAADESEVDFDMLFRWIEENIANEYEKPEEVSLAFERLARASLFSSRIMKRQNWKLHKYARVLAIAGVALSKQARYSKFTRYNFPSIVKKYSQARESRAALKSALKKTSTKLHCSLREARETLEMTGGVKGMHEFLELEEKESALFAHAVELVKQKRGNKKN